MRTLLLLAVSAPALLSQNFRGGGGLPMGWPWAIPGGLGCEWGGGWGWGGDWPGFQPWFPMMLWWGSGYPGWHIAPFEQQGPQPRSQPRSERRDWGRRDGWRRVGDEGDGWKRVNPRANWETRQRDR